MDNGFVSILISVILSVALSGGVSMYLFNRFGVNSESYKSLMKFARKNKNIKDYPELLENLEKRISELERHSDNINDNPEVIYIQNELKSHKDAIHALAKAVSGLNPNESEQTAELLKAVSARISLLEKKINTDSDNYCESRISAVEKQFADLQETVSKQNRVITELTRIIDEMRQNTAVKPPVPDTDVKPAPPKEPKQRENLSKPESKQQLSESVQKAVVPSETYLKYLMRELENLNGILGTREYNYCMEKLDDILQNGDFDDGEEIMQSVHEILKKYIYGSDTKVKNTDWKLLENYLMKAGYEPVAVKAGDRIRDYAVYFENVIPSGDLGEQGTIKLISQKPYVITYLDGGVKEQLKLCGKCTAYK
ncbi:MAG: hypothetical protein K2I06_08530 [Ruminococcus sp.]|nr:hypothetical protein [Ruminococcus sp.]